MQGIYTYIPETNYVPREYTVAAILLLLFMVLISLVSVLNLLYFYISTFRSICAVPNMAVLLLLLLLLLLFAELYQNISDVPAETKYSSVHVPFITFGYVGSKFFIVLFFFSGLSVISTKILVIGDACTWNKQN